MTPPLPLTGHCLCGTVTYTIDAEPMTVALCHCEDCRRQSGAPFSLKLAVDRDALHVDLSKLKTEVTIGDDTGEERQRMFCSECGSPVLSVLADSAQLWFHDPDAPERGVFPRSLPS